MSQLIYYFVEQLHMRQKHLILSLKSPNCTPAFLNVKKANSYFEEIDIYEDDSNIIDLVSQIVALCEWGLMCHINKFFHRNSFI